MTILGPILMVGVMALAVWLGMSEDGSQNIVLVDNDGQFGKVFFADDFESTESVKIFIHEGHLDNKEFEEGPYDGRVDLYQETLEAKSVNLIYKDNYPSMTVQRYIASRIENAFVKGKLIINNIDEEIYKKINTNISINAVDFYKKDETTGNLEIGLAVGFALAFIIYLFIFIYGAQVMRGVMEEKSSRIVEVIISSVKPFQLMMGKIVGVAMVGLTQVLMWVILSAVISGAVIPFVLPDVYSDPSSLVESVAAGEAQEEMAAQLEQIPDTGKFFWGIIHQTNFLFIIGMFLFYFVGGYLLYGSLFAAIGGAVDHETDTQQFMIPIVVPLVFGFIIAEMAFANPDGPAVFWGSIIPLTSPIVMMIKVGMMGMGFVEMDYLTIFLSMGLLIAGFLFTTWIAGRIYRVGILMYGKKVTYKDLWKWITLQI